MNRHSQHPEPPIRTTPYEGANRDSQRKKGDRVNYRPAKLADYLHWLQEGYALEAPGGSKTSKIHVSMLLEEDGDPAMTGEARGFYGFNQGSADPERDSRSNNWRKVARRQDEDGFFLTPMRAAIEQLPAERRRLVRDLATNLFTPLDVTAIHGIPDWCAGDVMHRSLTMLWACYTDRPIPRRTPGWVDKSESQRAAEDAA